MRLQAIEPQFVELVPSELAPGTLYVSMTYGTTVHLCACGCGNKVVLSLSPAQWRLYFDGDAISLAPSVGNWQFPCQSHYWIRGNEIVWAAQWSKGQIDAARRSDVAALDSYFAGRRETELAAEQAIERTEHAGSLWLRLWRWFRRKL